MCGAYRGALHLRGSLLGNLADEAQQAPLLVEGDVMPCGDVLACTTHSLLCDTIQ